MWPSPPQLPSFLHGTYASGPRGGGKGYLWEGLCPGVLLLSLLTTFGSLWVPAWASSVRHQCHKGALEGAAALASEEYPEISIGRGELQGRSTQSLGPLDKTLWVHPSESMLQLPVGQATSLCKPASLASRHIEPVQLAHSPGHLTQRTALLCPTWVYFDPGACPCSCHL